MDDIYLLHVLGSSTAVVPIPGDGQLLVGSGETAGLRIVAEGVAPLHARIVAEEATLAVEELPGGHGTSVNEHPLVGRRELASGDVIAIGGSTLVVQMRAPAASGRRVLAAGELRARLEEEIERSLRYDRSLSVIVLETEERPGGVPGDAASSAASVLRRVDLVGQGAGGEIEILLPETASAAAAAPVGRLLEVLGGRGLRAGIAVFPDDGISAAALLEGARAACQRAAPGDVASPRTAPEYQIGEQRLVAVDAKMTRLLALLRRLAPSHLPVLVTGETGVGKEAVVTRALHAWSPRARAPMVAINCAAIPDGLLESELFGHAAGAFTGAAADKVGLLESASGGTVLLDEIGECTARAQAELLRVLETGKVRRLGALAERPIDVRVVAATNRDLQAEVEAGRFRQDLYYRLCAASIVVPPLRDRPLDVAPLARAFLEECCRRRERPRPTLSSSALRRLGLHTWPGNVRELRHAIEFAAEVSDDEVIEAEHLPDSVGELAPWLRRQATRDFAPREAAPSLPPVPLYQEIRELEERRIREALAACDGVRVRAAERLGLPLRTLVTKIKEYGLQSVARERRVARRG